MRKKVHYLKKTLLMLLVALQVFGGLFPAGTLRKEASRPVQTAAAESAVPYSGTNNLDGSKIEGISVTWVTQDSTVTADGDPVSQEELADRPHLFVSTTSNKELSLVYKLEVELSGQYDYAPGDIIITLPAQVWHGRKYEETGEPGITAGVVDESVLLGGMELPVPEAPSTKADFNWQIIDNQYVLTNTRTIGATSSLSFEIAVNGVTPIELVDMSESEPISAHCEVVTKKGNTIELNSTPIVAQVDTQASITSAFKEGTMYQDRPGSLPDELLAKLPTPNTDDYIFIRWDTFQSHNNNQPYSLAVEDSLASVYQMIPNAYGDYDKQFIVSGTFLGCSNAEGKPIDDNSITFAADVGGPYEDVTTAPQYANTVSLWSAYPREKLVAAQANEDPNIYLFENTATWYLTEGDAASGNDPQKITTASDTATVTYAPVHWQRPTGSFIVHKYVSSEKTKSTTFPYALNQLEAGDPVEMEFILSTYGEGYPWTSILTKGKTLEELAQRAQDENISSDEEARATYGKLGWTQVTSDYQTLFNFENTYLTSDDFQIEYLRVDIPEKSRYAELPSGGWGYVPDNSLPTPDLTVEYQIDGDGTWHTAARAVWGNDGHGSLRFVDVNPEVSISGSTILFPDNVTDTRHYFTSNVFNGVAAENCDLGKVKWNVYVGMILKPTERIQNIVAELFENSTTPSSFFKNDVGMDVYGWGENGAFGEIVLDDDYDYASATLEGASYGVSMNKTSSASSDPENEQTIIHYTLTTLEQSNLKDRNDYDRAVADGVVPAETSCIWYDLLPPGVIPLLDTIKPREGDAVTNVYTIDDFRNTGRILLVVEADLTPAPKGSSNGSKYLDSPSISFDATYSWRAMAIYGRQLRNYAVFQSTAPNLRNNTLGTMTGLRGEPDSPLGGNNSTTPAFPEEIVNALTDLDPSTDEEHFLYSDDILDLTTLTYAVSGLEKTVRSDLVGVWSQGLDGQEQVTVYEGHNYTYKLHISSADNTSTKSIVIYDTIENYILPDPASAENPDSSKGEDYQHVEDRKNWQGTWQGKGQWRGTLTGVDLSDFVNAGVAPVLLYSEIPNLQFAETKSESTDDNFEEDTILLSSGNYDITNRDIWKVAELDENGKWAVPEGIAVSAIAIDASTAADGSEYILQPTASLSGYLHMRAPDDNGDPNVWDAKGAYAHTTAADGTQTVDWEAAKDKNNNMYAYNNTRVRLIQGHTDSQGITNWISNYRMIRNDYTRVGILPERLVVRKIWNDQQDHDQMRPNSVTVRLLRKPSGSTEEFVPVMSSSGEPITFQLSQSNNWTAEFAQLDLLDDQGVYYHFTFEEEPVEGYEPQVEYVESGFYFITNSHPNEQVSIKGEKLWDDENNAHGQRPDRIILRLYRDDKLLTSTYVRPNASGKWLYSFGERDRYAADGHEYVYRIEEEYVPKYSSTLEGNEQITNTYHPYGDLEVVKKLENATPEASLKEFTFTLVLLPEATEDNSPVIPLSDKFPYQRYRLEGGEWIAVNESESDSGEMGNGDTFILRGDEKIVISGIPSESRYEVIESPCAGFTANPTGDTGDIRADQTSTALFVNTYKTSGKAQLNLGKELTGHAIRKNQFRFELVDMNEDSPTYGQVLRTARINAPEEGSTFGGSGVEIYSEADAVFGQLTFSNEHAGKTMIYHLVERDIGSSGYTYDSNYFIAEITLTDDGEGNLTETVVIRDGTTGSEVILPEFVNSYTAYGELELRAWKTLTGRDLTEGEFTFELFPYDLATGSVGQPIDSATNDADGNIVFGAIPFDQDSVSLDADNPATYAFLIREQAGSDATVQYSTQEFVFVVSVEDNGDGTLSFTQNAYTLEGGVLSADPIIPVFNNLLHPGALSVSKEKDEDYGGDPDQEFTFHVKLSEKLNGELDYGIAVPVPTPTPTPGPGSGSTGEVLPPFVVSPTNTPKPTTEPVVLLFNTPKPAKPIVTSGYVHASASDLAGQAYAMLNKATGELVLFRSGNFTDPDGNRFAFDSGANRSEDTSRNVIYYILDENTTTSGGARPWQQDKTLITSVRTEDYIRPASCNNFFRELSNVTSYDLSKLDTSQVTNFDYMFYNNKKLTGIDISGFDTSKANSLSGMFRSCSTLEEIDLSTLDVSNVTDLSLMFSECPKLTSIDLSYLHTGKVSNFSNLFRGCTGLTSIDLSTLNTQSATSFASMFSGCTNLADVDITYLNTSKCYGLSEMFRGCKALTSLDLRTFNTANVTTMNGMFYDCSNLQSVDLSSFNTSKVTSMENMFRGCSSLENLDLSTFDTHNVKNFGYMFYNLKAGETPDLSTFDTSSATNMRYMFYGLTPSGKLDLSTFDTSKVTNMSYMFAYFTAHNDLDISHFDTSNVTNMSRMFTSISGMDVLDLRNFDTAKVTDMSYMFSNSKPSQIIVSSFDTGKTTTMQSMFWNCSNIKKLDLSNFNTDVLTSMYNMFNGCSNLEELNIAKFNTIRGGSLITHTYCFGSTPKLSTITIGDESRFRESYPSAPSTLPYDGTWVNAQDSTQVFASDPLFTSGGNAGTWTWNIATYKLSFLPGEQGAGSMPSVFVPCSTDFSFSPAFYSLGYDLVSFKDENGNVYPVENGLVTIPAATYTAGKDVTLTAQWLKQDNSVTMQDGQFTFTLKAGETIQFNNLPAGVGYEVWEECPSGWVLVKKTNESGQIEPLTTSEAVFTNRYNPNLTSAALRATKQMEGRTPEADEFTFTLHEGSTLLQTKTNAAGGGISFDLLAYVEEGEHIYTIREVPGDDPTIIYDSTAYTVKVSVTEEDGVLSAEVIYPDGEPPVFRNAVKPGALSITKVIQNATEASLNQQFTVEVLLTNAKGEPWSGTVKVNGTDAPVANGVLTLLVKNGSVANITGIPAGLRYTVSEPDELPGWTMDSQKSGTVLTGSTSSETLTNRYSLTGFASIGITKELVGRTLAEDEFTFELLDGDRVISTATNAADGSVRFDDIFFDAEGTYTFTIRETEGSDPNVRYSTETITATVVMEDVGGEGLLTATVTYSPDQATITNSLKPGSLSVAKTVESINDAHRAMDFTFTLSLADADGNPISGNYYLIRNNVSESLTVTNGSGSFQLKDGETVQINGLPNGARYTLTEEEAPGFTVESTGTSGVIQAQQMLPVSFTNTYHAEGEYRFSAAKLLEGRELVADEFIFVLMDEEGVELQVIPIDAEGRADFGVILFTEEDLGSHTYQIAERNTGAAGITYDETIHTVTLTIADKGDGTLSITDDLQGEIPSFTNLYSDKTALTVEKVWQDNDDSMQIRPESITVQLYRNNQQVDEATLTAETDWVYTFTDLPAFDEQGATYHYDAREVPVTGYTSTKEAENGRIIITNTPEGVLQVSKTVVGGSVERDFSFTVTLSLNGEALSVPVILEKDGVQESVSPSDGGLLAFALRHGQHARLLGLPIGTEYLVQEEAVTGYTTESTNASGLIQRGEISSAEFVNSMETTEFTVTKVWRGGGGSITLTLYANGVKMEPQPALISSGDVYTFQDLPTYDEEGNPIVYYAKEKYVEGYITIYKNEAPYTHVTNAIYSGGTIVNKLDTDDEDIQDADFVVTKQWRGLDGKKAPAIKLVLYCNGVPTDYETPRPSREGRYRYYNLPDTVNGQPAVYTVREEYVDNFETRYQLADGSTADYADNGGTIINTRIPPTGDHTPLALLMMLSVLSIVVLAMVYRRKRA